MTDEATNAGQPTAEQQQQQDAGQQQDTPQSFDEWLKGQPEAITKLYEGHTDGLRSALQKERDNNKTLTKQLKDLGGKLEEGSEARKALDGITEKLEAEQGRADFYEEAVKQGVVDLKLAWLAIQADADELVRRGRVDFVALKEQHPNLFAQQQPASRGNAGAGAGQEPGGTKDMNNYIRQAAGRN